MHRLLEPDGAAATIFEIDYDRLFADGKHVLLYDLDNTLSVGKPDRLTPRVEELLQELSSKGFRIGILSNRRWKIDAIVSSLSGRFPLHLRAGKPARRGFRGMLSDLGADPREAVMIGDRRLTDVLGARRSGIHSILVEKMRADPGDGPRSSGTTSTSR